MLVPSARANLAKNYARCDGSSWINASDRDLKQGFEVVDPQAVLERVTALPIQSWSYRLSPDQRHIGPTAQDFRAAFGLGQDDKSIATVDADGVALAAIKGSSQKLDAQSAALREALRLREAENADLKREVQELKRLVSSKSVKETEEP